MSLPRFALFCLLALLAVLYGLAWFAPAIGLAYSDGASLMMAVTHKSNGSPPLFPALLALFAMISRQALWLKLAPLLCTVFWLALTRRLLTKMGATQACGVDGDRDHGRVADSAVSGDRSFLRTALRADDYCQSVGAAGRQAADRGACAYGLSTITMTIGATLYRGLACLRWWRTGARRNAAIFAGSSMVFAAPWLGWVLAQHGVPGEKLHASEMAMLLGKNAMLLAASPFTLLNRVCEFVSRAADGCGAADRAGAAAAICAGSLFRLLLRGADGPDGAAAACFRTGAASVSLDAMAGRAPRPIRHDRRRSTALAMVPALWFCACMVPACGAIRTYPDNWHQMEKLFNYIRGNTPADAVLLADLDPVFYLNTGHTTVRGFVPDTYGAITPRLGHLLRPMS